ncbi:uncharacterized protein LOC115219095 [Argonauta hians]
MPTVLDIFTWFRAEIVSTVYKVGGTTTMTTTSDISSDISTNLSSVIACGKEMCNAGDASDPWTTSWVVTVQCLSPELNEDFNPCCVLSKLKFLSATMSTRLLDNICPSRRLRPPERLVDTIWGAYVYVAKEPCSTTGNKPSICPIFNEKSSSCVTVPFQPLTILSVSAAATSYCLVTSQVSHREITHQNLNCNLPNIVIFRRPSHHPILYFHTCQILELCSRCHRYRHSQQQQQQHCMYLHRPNHIDYVAAAFNNNVFGNKHEDDSHEHIDGSNNNDNSSNHDKNKINNNNSNYTTNIDCHPTYISRNINKCQINICVTAKSHNSRDSVTSTATSTTNTTTCNAISNNSSNSGKHIKHADTNRKSLSWLFTLCHQFFPVFLLLHCMPSSRNVMLVTFTMLSLGMLPATSEALHLQGVWKSSNFFLFLAKFGFQKTDLRDLEHTQGIIYGQMFSNGKNSINVTPPHSMLTLVLVDSEYFMEYYSNRTLSGANRCPRMFNKIDTIAFDYKCRPKGLEDFLRKVPCPENNICVDEDDPKDVIEGFQFTYRIRDMERPRFWYLSLAACHRNHGHNKSVECQWMQTSDDIEIAYDIWLVNGHPSMKHINPFEHQFSFELHDVAEIYLIALLLYCILLGVWLRAYNKLTKHPVTKLLSLTIILETFSILLNCIDVIKFSFDGIGVKWLSVLGNGIGVISECLFMLLVLVIAKGWAITSMNLNGKWLIFSVWGLYTVLNAVLFVWSLTEIDIISNTGEWHTGPGYLTLVFRLIIMLWFLYELRWTFLNDPQSKRLLFFQHFGAGILVWFVYLPVLVIVSLQISALWRFKTILSISFAANFLSAVCIVHLLWPSRSVLYLIKQDELIGAYEMEVTGFLEDPENSTTASAAAAAASSTAPTDNLQDGVFHKLSHKPTGSSLLKTVGKINGEASVPEDKEFLLS